MLHIPFKRRLAIAVSCVLLITIMLPLTAFAQAHSASDLAQSPLSTTITDTCPSQTSISLPAFKVGDTIHGTITLTTTDDVSNEINENEVLVLSDTVSGASFPFAPTAQATPQSFDFTMTAANDTLQACIQNHDDDEVGTVTITSVTSPKPTPSPNPGLDSLKIYYVSHHHKITIVDINLEKLGNVLAVLECVVGTKAFDCLSAVLKAVRLTGGEIRKIAHLLGVGVEVTGCVVIDVPLELTATLACAGLTVSLIQELVKPGGD